MNQPISIYRLCRMAVAAVAALLLSDAALAQCTGSLGAPIVNETFGAGAVNPGPPLAASITNLVYVNNDCPNDGQYTIANFTKGCYSPNWHTLRDHTGDANGYFMLINASEQPSDFFVQTVSGLCDGTTYQFSAWIVNMDSMSGILPNVTFTIETTGGTVLQTYNTGNIPITDPATWQQYGFYFTTTTGVDTVVLIMYNNAPGGDGNDLALDDIQFRPAGPETVVGTAIGRDTIVNVCTLDQTVSLTSTSTSDCYVNTAFQWQVSRDTVNWTDIAGATTAQYDPPTQAPGVYYFRLEVAQAGNIGISSCSVFSNLVKVTYTNITPVLDSLVATICNGELYTLPSGKAVGKTGVYEDTLYSSGGCDSVNTMLNLTVITAKTAAVNAEICPGDDYTLPSGKTENAAGEYIDTLKSKGGCDSVITTLNLTIATSKTVSVDATICNGSFYTLPSGREVSVAGMYTDTVLNSIGCDSLNTNLTLDVTVSTTVSVDTLICNGTFYVLPSGKEVSAAGFYTDTLRTAQGCDSIITHLDLSVNSLATPSVAAEICSGSLYTLPSGQQISVAGVYEDTIRNVKGCDSIITTVTLKTDSPPGGNSSGLVCLDSSTSITAGNGFISYLWNTGAGTASITAFAGVYTVKATDSIGCNAFDTFNISNYAPPVVTLDQDIVLCTGEPRKIDAGMGYASYLWNTGSDSETISITATGTYWVTVKDANNCPGSDTTVVGMVATPPVGFLPAEVSKCSYNSITLSASNEYAVYLWSTGSTESSITVASAGQYWLTVTDNNDCSGTDTTTVEDSACKEFVYVPSAFTPNGDGRNDVFKPVVYGLAVQYDFAVYNRWGQKVFESGTPGVGWDGTVNSMPAPSGTYVWELAVTLSGDTPLKQKGTVVLMR